MTDVAVYVGVFVDLLVAGLRDEKHGCPGFRVYARNDVDVFVDVLLAVFRNDGRGCYSDMTPGRPS